MTDFADIIATGLAPVDIGALPDVPSGVTAGTYTAANVTVDSRGRVTAAANGGLLASTAYNPSVGVTASTTSLYSTAYVDVDSNLAVTFTVPATGNVLVRANALIDNTTATTGVVFALNEGASTLAGTAANVGAPTSNSQRVTATWKITGLTPGSVHTYKLAWAVIAASTAHMYIGGGNTNPNGPATIEVWSA